MGLFQLSVTQTGLSKKENDLLIELKNSEMLVSGTASSKDSKDVFRTWSLNNIVFK